MNDDTPLRQCDVTPNRNRSRLTVPDGALCSYCGAPATVMDHIYPWSALTDPEELAASGLVNQDDPRNLTPACQPCNMSKGAKPLVEWLIGCVVVPYTVDWVDVAQQCNATKSAIFRAIRHGRCAPWVAEIVRDHGAEAARRFTMLAGGGS